MANINQMGIPGVYEGGILQPKLTNRWRITFGNFGGSDGAAGSDTVSMQAVSVNRPTVTFETIELHRYNSRAKIAGKHSFDSISLTIEDDVAGKASSAIRAQMQRQQHLIGAEGPFLGASPEGSLYKFSALLAMLDGSANKDPIETWVLEGCYIESANYGELNYENSSQVTIQLTLQYDHARQEQLGDYNHPGNATGGAGGTGGVVS